MVNRHGTARLGTPLRSPPYARRVQQRNQRYCRRRHDGDLPVMDTLLKKGANPNARGSFGTPRCIGVSGR